MRQWLLIFVLLGSCWGQLVIKGKNGLLIEGKHISSKSGDCVQVTDSQNITIQNSEIGPCAGVGIKIFGGSGISIFDSYLHVETLNTSGRLHRNDNIYAAKTSNLTIQGNVIAFGEGNIHVDEGHGVQVVGNFLLNARANGQVAKYYPDSSNFQSWSLTPTSPDSTDVTVTNNYSLTTEDASKYLNAGATDNDRVIAESNPGMTTDSIGFGHSDRVIAQNNFITGGQSPAGCGLISDNNNRVWLRFLNNRVLDTGQCGIGIDDGENVLVEGNKVHIRNPVPGSGNQPITVRHPPSHAGHPCGPVTLSNNASDMVMPDGTHRGFFLGVWPIPPCAPVTHKNDIPGAPAHSLLAPATVFVPPMIPPQPKNCTVSSPYTTQTSMAKCAKF